MDSQYIFFIVLVFIASFFVLEGVYYWWTGHYGGEAKKLKNRLEDIANSDFKHSAKMQSILKRRYENQSNYYYSLINKLPILHLLDEMIMQSGVLWTYKKLFQLTLAAGAVSFVLCSMLGFSFFTKIIIAFASFFLPIVYLSYKKKQRLSKFEEQLPEAIDSIARSVRAGHSFNAAFNMIGEEFPDPIANEFNMTVEEGKLGVGTNEAMLNLAKRVPITDLQFFIVAVLIQRETGGNLGEILGNISGVIRQRFTLNRQILVMTAEGRMSGRVLGAMPIIMLGVMSVADKNYAQIMFGSEVGQYWLKVGAIMMIVGFFWISRTVKIKM